MPRIMYRCNHCNQEHTSEERAKRCEEGHVQPVGITNASYNHRHAKEGMYPGKILVAFADGKTIRYARDEAY